MSIFGFSTEATGGNGDIVPIVKYDARAGRVFRVDRTNDGQGYVNTPVDITRSFKAIFDLENVEVGWLNFNTGGAPSFTLVAMGQAIPPRPTPDHRNGARVMVKLAKECAGDEPIREIASVAKVFLIGLEELYHQYAAQKDANLGKLPVVVLEDSVPITSGSGAKSSTNYQPKFKITGWAPRGDLAFKPKSGGTAAPPQSTSQPVGSAPPKTGSTVASPPTVPAAQPAAEMAGAEDDFG